MLWKEPLEKMSPIPLYYQIWDRLRGDIKEGHIKPGEPLPSEELLAKTYGVSRLTVRQAIAALVDEGLVYRKRGKGSFVTELRIEQKLSHLTSFTEEMAQRGLVASSQVLSATSVGAEPQIAEKLKLTERGVESVFQISRLRYADGKEVAYEEVYIPQDLYQKLLAEDLAGSINALLEKQGYSLDFAEQVIAAGLPGRVVASHLKITANTPVLKMSRLYLQRDGLAIQYVNSIFRADRYQLISVLKR
jgi:GntR family transcriptional regulator